MLALSLLLCAAGVKAMLGIKVDSVHISDTQYICSNNCAFDGAFFQDDGGVCAMKELVVVIDKEGEEDPEELDFYCAEGASSNPHARLSTRPPKNGEEPYSCDLYKIDPSPPERNGCEAQRLNGDNSQNTTEGNAGPVLEQWSEVKKMHAGIAGKPRGTRMRTSHRRISHKDRLSRSVVLARDLRLSRTKKWAWPRH